MSSERSTTYTVVGMSCAHCEQAVKDELARVAGVQAVEVDLPSGTVAVTGNMEDEDVRAAVHKAGYEVAA